MRGKWGKDKRGNIGKHEKEKKKASILEQENFKGSKRKEIGK